ncbi:MAG: hypothetical protein J3K34DRAFT_412056 [Monoraphidium minutum]|nr:MAG: hypothetical protein J3K34DRAFT_412056 [Monoraphidium minutum]
MYLVAIGTDDKGAEFASRVGFPEARLLADPDTACYQALAFNNGIKFTAFNGETTRAIKKRREGGGDADLKDALKVYKPLMPSKVAQVLWQGGALVFDGPRVLWAHSDPAVAAHADIADVVAAATQGARA